MGAGGATFYKEYGLSYGEDGGLTSAFGFSVLGGQGGSGDGTYCGEGASGSGGSGGSGGAKDRYSNGGKNGSTPSEGGHGQYKTTCEFDSGNMTRGCDSGVIAYAAGGGKNTGAGANNTGNGGAYGGKGGSGVIIIRNHR